MLPLKSLLASLEDALLADMEEYGSIRQIPAGEEIMREGQYVKMLPVVLEGAIKVFVTHDEKELLLYYIEKGQSCIMSFNAILKNISSKMIARTENDSTLLLLPADKVKEWMKTFPSFNSFFFNLYDSRYWSLLDSISHLLFDKLDDRLYSYLLEKSRQKKSAQLSLRHWQIAAEMGSTREVITRVLKKLEQDGKIKQTAGCIEML